MKVVGHLLRPGVGREYLPVGDYLQESYCSSVTIDEKLTLRSRWTVVILGSIHNGRTTFLYSTLYQVFGMTSDLYNIDNEGETVPRFLSLI